MGTFRGHLQVLSSRIIVAFYSKAGQNIPAFFINTVYDWWQMITLINTNRMEPLIGPIGLDYVATSARTAGIDVEILDLALVDEPDRIMKEYFASKEPILVGLTFRNVDDCFWPSANWFVPKLKATIAAIRNMTEAHIVLGGVGFSIFAKQIVEYTGADFGIKGDGEQAITLLAKELQTTKKFIAIPGLIWKENGIIKSNSPAWLLKISLPTSRDAIDNPSYFRLGGQAGLETKRGCDRNCIYCADPLAKGTKLRLRAPSEVADEAQSLLNQGIDVLHLCDSEFNIPRRHALDVCNEFINRSLGDKLSWYAYLSVVPFDAELATAMARAGCVGINFTADSVNAFMLDTYKKKHTKNELAKVVKLCRDRKIDVMMDLLFGGPGETEQTLTETIDFIKRIDPDCAGAALGIRIYPDTPMQHIAAMEYETGNTSNIHRKYDGPIDVFKPTYYISEKLGPKPAKLVKDIIDGDKRFFEPAEDRMDEIILPTDDTGYNYNDNTSLVEAIRKGRRGAYWNILRKLRNT
ncbi:MAG: B12-binding domain-containing radical SAM protein [Planctomycetota bacterium]|jgi:radical SAM superfamily enzyme YgiQ (UPF0313 family)